MDQSTAVTAYPVHLRPPLLVMRDSRDYLYRIKNGMRHIKDKNYCWYGVITILGKANAVFELQLTFVWLKAKAVFTIPDGSLPEW